MSVDISMKHNEDLILDFQLLNELNEPVDDLLGAIGVLQIRGHALDEDYLIEQYANITASTGSIQFTVPDSIMTTLLPEGDMRRSLVYGTRITYADGTDEEPVSGRIKLYRGVVR